LGHIGTARPPDGASSSDAVRYFPPHRASLRELSPPAL